MLQQRGKNQPEIAQIWGSDSIQSPQNQLLLKAAAYANSIVRDQILKWISSSPQVQNRVHFIERTDSHQEHLAHYNKVDLALDTFPYNGTTTTCESLWMGVLTLTLSHSAYEQSRVGASLLQQADLSTFATDSPQQYIAIACALCDDPIKLQNTAAPCAPISARAVSCLPDH